jgi:hypothetical protein
MSAPPKGGLCPQNRSAQLLTATNVKVGRLLSKGLRLYQTGNHEWSRRQGDPCRVDSARHDSNVGAGNAADGFPQRESSQRLSDQFVTENVDETVAKALKFGAAARGPVMDLFWGDHCGAVVDPEAYIWMIATHMAEPTPKEMQQKMKEQLTIQPAAHAARAD